MVVTCPTAPDVLAARPWLGLGFDLVDAVKNEIDDSRPPHALVAAASAVIAFR